MFLKVVLQHRVKTAQCEHHSLLVRQFMLFTSDRNFNEHKNNSWSEKTLFVCVWVLHFLCLLCGRDNIGEKTVSISENTPHTYVCLIFLYELDTSGRAGIRTFVHQTNLSGIHFNLNQNTGLIFFQTKVFRETGKSESVFCVLTCHKGSISININFLSKTYVSVSYSLD